MPILTELARVPCAFHSRFWTDFYDTWQWRLDPYRISAEEPPELTVLLDPRGEAERSDGLLADEVATFFRRQVLRAGDGGTLWQFLNSRDRQIVLQFHVSGDWRQIRLNADRTGTAGTFAFEYLGQMMPSVLLNQQVLTLHGVLMEYGGKGILLSAASGTGKTTHARLWRDRKGALILNGDRAACRRVNGVWMGFGLPWSGTSGEQVNRSVPISALVILERGKENEACRMAGMESFGAMWPHVQCPGWDEALTARALELTDAFLAHIPVLRLRCRPDGEAVEVLRRALEEL